MIQEFKTVVPQSKKCHVVEVSLRHKISERRSNIEIVPFEYGLCRDIEYILYNAPATSTPLLYAKKEPTDIQDISPSATPATCIKVTYIVVIWWKLGAEYADKEIIDKEWSKLKEYLKQNFPGFDIEFLTDREEQERQDKLYGGEETAH
jgi:hypothetical protein